MAEIIPSEFGPDWWSSWHYPERIEGQRFGVRLYDEDFRSTSYKNSNGLPKKKAMSSGVSEVKNDKKQFTISLCMKQFKPEDIEVKVVDNCIVIRGEFEERNEESGICSRKFTRRYILPKDCEAETVTSSLSLDGTLTIVAPKKLFEETTS
ncbi:alpha-crystallin B chain [Trichonephila inaurata madagascariensis]|uniref:Alpha-crystallin B chain n=1 Tax=Trichonephila inaurata madagascariensis TaxID=2747483 RepID=A0A8X7C5I2_9ARAC|nr:alpha-crystallin B chain [Trichonephila inaurata madagascariensis]